MSVMLSPAGGFYVPKSRHRRPSWGISSSVRMCRCLLRSDQADPCLTNGSMLRTILALVSPVIHAGSSAKGNSISQRSSTANRFLRLQPGGPPCLRFQSERFYFWQWHLLQLLPRPLGKATNAIAPAKRGVSPDTRAKAAIPARIVSPTSTSVELLAGGCVATDPTQPAWREGARTPDR